MIKRILVAIAAAAALAVVVPGPTAAATPPNPPGCTTWLNEERTRAFGSCDATVTRPWRLVFGFTTTRVVWVRTEYSLSPKEACMCNEVFSAPLYDAFIELQP